MKKLDRLYYESIMEFKISGKELCAYIRNPENSLEGSCALSGRRCKDIFADYRGCEFCREYFMRVYKIDVRTLNS